MTDTRDPRTERFESPADHLSAEPGGLLMRWLDGEVTAAERTRVRAHVADCPACTRERP